MPSHDASIQWFEARKGKVVYSMSARLGPNSYDCSSAVYLSLIAGGFCQVVQWAIQKPCLDR